MAKLFATSPCPFPGFPKDDAFRVMTGMHALGSYVADARVAYDLFAQATSECAAAHKTMFERMGDWPLAYRYQYLCRVRGIHARAFVFALDGFARELEIISKDCTIGTIAAKQHQALVAALPTVLDVRNSLHHEEDRRRGLRTGGKSIDPQPVNTGGIVVETGAKAMLIGTNIQGSKVGCTAANGHYLEVDVSVATIEIVVGALQALIDGIPWDPGMDSPVHYPDFGENRR